MGLQDVKGEGMGETLKGDDGILQEEKRTEDRGSWKTTGRDKDGMCRGRRKARLVSQRPRQGIKINFMRVSLTRVPLGSLFR